MVLKKSVLLVEHPISPKKLTAIREKPTRHPEIFYLALDFSTIFLINLNLLRR